MSKKNKQADIGEISFSEIQASILEYYAAPYRTAAASTVVVDKKVDEKENSPQRSPVVVAPLARSLLQLGVAKVPYVHRDDTKLVEREYSAKEMAVMQATVMYYTLQFQRERLQTINLPDHLSGFMQQFEQVGQIILGVGGAPRDLLLCTEPNDLDFIIDGSIGDVQKIFPEFVASPYVTNLCTGFLFDPVTQRKIKCDIICNQTFLRSLPKCSSIYDLIEQWNLLLLPNARSRNFTCSAVYVNADGILLDPTNLGILHTLLGIIQLNSGVSLAKEPNNLCKAMQLIAHRGFKLCDQSKEVFAAFIAKFTTQALNVAVDIKFKKQLFKLFNFYPLAAAYKALEQMKLFDYFFSAFPSSQKIQLPKAFQIADTLRGEAGKPHLVFASILLEKHLQFVMAVKSDCKKDVAMELNALIDCYYSDVGPFTKIAKPSDREIIFKSTLERFKRHLKMHSFLNKLPPLLLKTAKADTAAMPQSGAAALKL